MARSTTNQPMVINSSDLAIGLMKIFAREVNPATQFLINESTGADTAITADATSIPADMVTNDALGAVQEAGVEATPTFKEHQSGYPKQTDKKITETTSCIYNVSLEEIMSDKGGHLLDLILNTLNTGTLHYLSIGAMAQFAESDVLKFYSPICILKPELNFSIDQDWGAIPLQFEAVYNADFTYNKLIYWEMDTSPTAREDQYQPITINSDDLMIGKMQFRLGKFANRASISAITMPARQVVGTSSDTVTSSGTYTGTVDGAYIIEISADGLTFDWTDPEGNKTTGVSVDAVSPVALEDGVSVLFSADPMTADEVFVFGVYATGAKTGNDSTGITCPYPYLPSTYSIGAVASTEMSTDITYKDHVSGYPEKKTLSILESVSINATANIEEMSFTSRPSVDGEATTLADAIMDSATTGALYNAPLEIIIESVSGKTLSFWMPNAQLVPEVNFAPSDDWANLAVTFTALKQSSVNTIYKLIKA